ncbi:hypothetical protein CVU82_03995 [Candidatus Falkowbacteria bacterium HGW-Falkowbacteria-1]|uniref:DUF192 domain-containing protein n=1 Tax=Candidatus Falkowbacteria bacterium HGW-Falkowbacteria-1 TaxID=2013768 RepID=A0A2N2E8W8_9BACT|nr:MAG: hypothetical protein CVU82_03995 [Candidatus Falkowbacteria bacterium HGW-Falkowbacteria-1]
MIRKLFNKKTSLPFLVLLVFIFLFSLFFIHSRPVDKKTGKIKIGAAVVDVEIASSPAEHYLGLSYRDSLLENSGMLFLFQNEEERAFVMRDMRFTLDIVFIDKNEIVSIYKDLPFDEDSQGVLYESLYPVDKVLELNGGFCDKNKIKVGDFLEFL